MNKPNSSQYCPNLSNNGITGNSSRPSPKCKQRSVSDWTQSIKQNGNYIDNYRNISPSNIALKADSFTASKIDFSTSSRAASRAAMRSGSSNFSQPPTISSSSNTSSPYRRTISRSTSRSSLSSFESTSMSSSRISSNTLYLESPLSDNFTASNNANNNEIRIQVAIRPKPLGKHEIDTNIPWKMDFQTGKIENSDIGTFKYDYLFNPDNENSDDDVYEIVAHPIIKECLKGYNGIVFAYGMTGSGKTHSMRSLVKSSIYELFGHMNTSINDENLHEEETFIVDETVNSGNRLEYIQCSILEIYNEKLRDLLSEKPNENKNLDLRIVDDNQFGVKVLGLNEVKVDGMDHLFYLIEQAENLRSIDSTEYNYRSSRSHFIIMLKLFSIDSVGNRIVSVLNFCDLAGSERATSHVDRRKEGSYINKSLLALGAVISKLSDRNSHIPYRDSKLTRLLQPSLNGDSVVSILCTIQLGCNVVGETTNTLRFGSRAKNVLLNLKKNTTPVDVSKIITENQQLREELKELKQLIYNDNSDRTNMIFTDNGMKDDDVYYELIAENNILNEQVEHFKRLQMEENIIRSRESNVYFNKLYNLVNNTVSNSQEREEAKNLMALIDKNLKEYDSKFQETESYVGHLENRIRSSEIELARFKQDFNNRINPTMEDTSPMGKEEKEIVAELKEELQEMKQSMLRKDAMIRALQRVE